jgi:hypothetical protein
MAAPLLVLGGLVGTGLFLNGESKKTRGQENVRDKLSMNQMPNGTNIYNSNRYRQVQQGIQNKANERYRKSQYPVETGMMPFSPEITQFTNPPKQSYNYKKDINPLNKQFNPNEYVSKYIETVRIPAFDRSDNTVNKKPYALDRTAPLTCEQSNSQQFQNQNIFSNQRLDQRLDHNNMTPFYKGTGVNQNSYDENFQYDHQSLETFTGQTIDSKEKKEVDGLLFKPVQENIFSEPSLNIGKEERYVPSIYRRDELPFQQQQPSNFASIGGNHIYRVHERNVDELRATSNPKIIYNQQNPVHFKKSDILEGATYVKNVGVTEPFNQNNPERFYQQTADQWVVTTGDQIKPQRYENYCENLRHTDRPLLNTVVQGHAGTGSAPVNQRNRANIAVKVGDRPQFNQYSAMNNAYSQKTEVYDPHDIPQATMKQLNLYQTGDQGAQAIGQAQKMQVYDPNDIAPATMKQRNLYQTGDQGSHAVSQSLKMQVYDPYDVAPATMKQLNLYQTGDQSTHAVEQAYKMQVYDANDIAPPTMKQLNLYQTGEQSAYPSDRAPKLQVYDPNDVSAPTLKQLAMYKDYIGQHAELYNTGTGYKIATDTAYPTLKQITSNVEYGGGAGATDEFKGMSYEQMRNLHIIGLKSLTNIYHPPTQQGDKQAAGENSVFIKEPTSKKLNWNNRVEGDKVYNPFNRHIPIQNNRREVLATQFYPEQYDVANPLVINISRSTIPAKSPMMR